MNAHCERFNRTLQDELVDYNLYDLEGTDEFNDKISDYLFWYNAKRPHYSLGQIHQLNTLK
jgi:transposase InsO family protein